MSKSIPRRALAIILCVGLLLPLSARPAGAQTLTLEIGQPNVWSLAQAHYLLSHMRHENRGLHATVPSGDQLNPNSINGARLDILRTFLGISGEFSAPAGAQNRAALQGFQQAMARRQEAQNRVTLLNQQHLAVVQEISDLNFQLAQLPAPPAANQTEDPQTAQLRRELTAKVAARVPVRDALAAELTSQNAILNAAAPTLTGMSSMAAPTPPSVTFNDDLKTLMDKLLSGTTAPHINASTALDNFIQFQYEVIAKQLTLLRDEVGPDERLIFLELPSSLYSVPKKDDNYIVQTNWNVHSYLGTCSDLETIEDVDEGQRPGGRRRWTRRAAEEDETSDAQQPPPPPDADGDPDAAASKGGRGDDARSDASRERPQRRPITIDAINTFSNLQPMLTSENLRLASAYEDFERSEHLFGDERETFLKELRDAEAQTAEDLNTLRALKQSMHDPGRTQAQRRESESRLLTIRQIAELNPEAFPPGFRHLKWRPVSEKARRGMIDPCAVGLSESKFRIVDIIPRQSALNVNDTHATQSGFALTAKFLAIFGFGASVGYQRQRSVYEQFIHQDVFASGFGKGLDHFGWTIGPTPGTKRLAPGPRTTYAILAIPRGAVAVKVEANAVAFRNKRAPDDDPTPLVTNKLFTVVVPQRDTEGFWLDSVVYTPVPSGQRVTVLLRGKYFSPLTGVTVDGLPLKRAVALAKHESEEVTNDGDTTAPGEFEYLNPHELILNFKLAADFVGTPLITLITPEKTSAINYYDDLEINHRRRVTSLLRHSQSEPMFIGGFRLAGLQLTTSRWSPTIRAELTGSGFRNSARISVNGQRVWNPRLLSTNLYSLSFPRPTGETWTVTYRLGQQEASIVFNPAVDGLGSIAPSIESIENPTTSKPEGTTAGGEQVIIRGTNLHYVRHVRFGTVAARIDPSNRHPNVLFVTVPKGKEGAVRVLLTGMTPDGDPVSNILDFKTPGKAIYKYVPKPK